MRTLRSLRLGRSDPIGYLFRQVHHWSAVVFVAAIIVHMGRIFFTAAFRKPRELNWVVGVLLLTLASLTGFTGYSLPNDAFSGTGLRIGTSVALSVPLVGAWASNLLNGGGYPGPLLLSHIYTIHVYFLPVTIGALLGVASRNAGAAETHPVRRGRNGRRRAALLSGLPAAHGRGVRCDRRRHRRC